jgi:hypothetical protein
MTLARRLESVEASRSPAELVVGWLDEAHAFDDLATYSRWLLDQPDDVHPVDRLCRETEHGVRARLARRNLDEIGDAIRREVRSTLMRYELVLRINTVARETVDRETLVATIVELRIALLAAHVGSPETERPLLTCRRLTREKLRSLGAMEAARTSVEARYLDAYPALFPAEARRWAEVRALLVDVAAFAEQMVVRGGWPVDDADPNGTNDELEWLTEDLVEPAKVTALEMLGYSERSYKHATEWVRSRMADEAGGLHEAEASV